MRVALVAVGDELLTGDVLDTNTAWAADRLRTGGATVVHAALVGDDVADIARDVIEALGRADAVIVIGGLGPTSDDVTREGLAAAAGLHLRRDPAVEAQLSRWYTARGHPLRDVARRQADVPAGAKVLANHHGSAPGLRLEVRGRPVYAVPGVPEEMRMLMAAYVLPELASGPMVATVVLHTALVGESVLATMLAPLESTLPATVRLAYLAAPGQVRLRLTGPSGAVAGCAAQARRLLGDVVVGLDGETLEAAVHRLLRERGATVATAESLTGGGVGAALTETAGSSATYRGGVTAYATTLKGDLLGVERSLLAARGPVQAEVARAMARGVRHRLGATYGVATTGVAGPEPQDGVPVGVVNVAAAGPGREHSVDLRLAGDRSAVRRLTVVHALDLLRRFVLGLPAYADQEGAR